MTPSSRPRRRGGPRRAWAALVVLAMVVVAACGGGADSNQRAAAGTSAAGSAVRLYTSYNQPEVDAVVAAFQKAQPGTSVEVFRAPTGQINARVAAEQRSGGVRGDVLLLSDPLSMQQYAAQGLLRRWSPPDAAAVPRTERTDTFWGVTTSDVVVVAQPGKAPRSWQDLAGPAYRDGVALPDPSFAGSAFGALGYFTLAKGYGIDFYHRLKANGAAQVQAPGDVITGVAEKRYLAGMTLDFLARAAIKDGAPLEQSAPAPGAVRLYAPVAVFEATANAATAESFANFLLTRPAQQALAALDRHPIRADVPATAAAVQEVVPDWPRIFTQQAKLLADYRAVFGD